jgi:hypothetical protein
MVGKYFAVGSQRLFKDFATVRHEQQGRPVGAVTTQPAVVERRDYRLPGAGRGDDQVSMPIVQLSLGGQRFQHLDLVGIGPDLKAGQHDPPRCVGSGAIGDGECVIESITVVIRVIALETAVIPIGVKGRAELRQQRRRRDPGQPDIPLHSVQQRRSREVRRSDIGRVEFRSPAKEPGLGVQSGSQRVVLDPDLGAEIPHQSVQRDPFSGPHVRRRHHPQRHSAPA